MNQANIDSLTEKIKVGDLVKILFQGEPTFGLVVKISSGQSMYNESSSRRSMTFLTLMTKVGLRKYPIFWCEPVVHTLCKLDK